MNRFHKEAVLLFKKKKGRNTTKYLQIKNGSEKFQQIKKGSEKSW